MKKKKILITGCLGYVATAFINQYAAYYDIIGIDNNFIPDRVANLVSRGGKFYQKDLFDIGAIVNEADIVIHTAGITDVPQTLSQSKKEKDDEIIKVGVDGTREIIKNLNADAKIIFLSTHVIFEGLNTNHVITEVVTPHPLLAYSRSKYISELDLLQTKNYVILRLASVYGLPAFRWKIVANLFAKMTAVNGQIKVFGADCIKPLVGVYDVARVFDFVIKNDINRETYNVVNENLKVKEIAEICKAYRPDLKIDYTNDEVINNGYALSNEKLLKTGFQFKDNVNDSMRQMIASWRNRSNE